MLTMAIREVQDAASGVLPFPLGREGFRTARRSLLERYVAVLQAIESTGPMRRTRILYRANLTWEELKVDLRHLSQAGLIREFLWKEGIFYAITDLGLQALSHYRELSRSLQLQPTTGG